MLRGIVADSVRPENVAFLFLQTMEKALRAVTVAREHSVPLVHDLGYELSALDQFADLEDMKGLAKKVLDWSQGQVQG